MSKNAGTQTLTGGGWYADAPLKLPGNITTNSASIFVDIGGSILNSGGTNAILNLTSNQGGLLDAGIGGSVSVTPNGGTFTNNNSSQLQATYGSGVTSSLLTINGNVINTNSSTIQALGSASSFPTINITGNLTNDSTSNVEAQSGGSITVGGNLTNNAGTVVTGNAPADTGNSTILVNGSLNNTGGTLSVLQDTDSVTVNTKLNNTSGGTVTVVGGMLNVTGNLVNDATSTVQVQSGGTLSVGNLTNSNQVITGNGAGDSGFSSIYVSGTLTNESGATVSLEATGDYLNPSNLSNAGTINALSQTLIDLGTGPFTNPGYGLDQSNGTLTESIAGSTGALCRRSGSISPTERSPNPSAEMARASSA